MNQTVGRVMPDPLPLPKRRFLDVRPALEAQENPIVEAVNIPFDELPNRMFELPRKSETIRLVGGGAQQGAEFLSARGRSVVVETSWVFGESGPGRLWDPNSFLLASVAGLTPGRALDLACGSGRDAVALALLGWQVTAVDHLPDAVDNGRVLVGRCNVEVEWQVSDLRRFPSVGTSFDLVTCFYWWNTEVIHQAVEILAPGGTLLVETFSPEHRRRFGKPSREELVLDPRTAWAMFPGAFVEETVSNSRYVCRVKWKK